MSGAASRRRTDGSWRKATADRMSSCLDSEVEGDDEDEAILCNCSEMRE